jgi:chromosome segregation ATPase
MKDSKVLFMVISVILAVIVIFTLVHNSKLKRENDKVQAYFDQTLQALNEIQDSLAEIDTKDMMIHRIAMNPEVNDSLTSNKEQIMASIQNLNDYIAMNKERLANLEQSLRDKNMEMKGLQRIIKSLKKNIAEKESLIVELYQQIGTLQEKIDQERKQAALEIAQREETISTQQSTIGTQQETISSQTSTIQKQEEEMNTIFFISAPKNELIEKGFLTKGGLFSSSKKSSEYNEEAMKNINVAQFNEILIKGKLKNVKVLTDQNKKSYTLEARGEETILKITNPNEFRKVKYLVVQTN